MPLSLFTDWDFELDDPAWVWDNSYRLGSGGVSNTACALLLSTKSVFGSFPSRLSQPITTEVGERYFVFVASKEDSGNGDGPHPEMFVSDVGGVVTIDNKQNADTSVDYQTWLCGSFVARETQTTVGFSLAAPGYIGSLQWYLDNAYALKEAELAVMLAEMPVAAMMATLQSYLSAELTAIRTERGDSLTVTYPTGWYCWERPAAAPEVAECEVYEKADGVSFPLRQRDASYWTIGQRVPVASQVDVVVAINHAARSGEKPSVMRQKDWRYGAAVIRVVRNYPTLGRTSDLLVAWPTTVQYGTRATDSGESVSRVEVVFTCALHETATGEGLAGQGAPPSATLEQVG